MFDFNFLVYWCELSALAHILDKYTNSEAHRCPGPDQDLIRLDLQGKEHQVLDSQET